MNHPTPSRIPIGMHSTEPSAVCSLESWHLKTSKTRSSVPDSRTITRESEKLARQENKMTKAFPALSFGHLGHLGNVTKHDGKGILINYCPPYGLRGFFGQDDQDYHVAGNHGHLVTCMGMLNWHKSCAPALFAPSETPPRDFGSKSQLVDSKRERHEVFGAEEVLRKPPPGIVTTADPSGGPSSLTIGPELLEALWAL